MKLKVDKTVTERYIRKYLFLEMYRNTQNQNESKTFNFFKR